MIIEEVKINDQIAIGLLRVLRNVDAGETLLYSVLHVLTLMVTELWYGRV